MRMNEKPRKGYHGIGYMNQIGNESTSYQPNGYEYPRNRDLQNAVFSFQFGSYTLCVVKVKV